MQPTKEQLALHGGEPTVQVDDPEQWTREIEKEKNVINDLLDAGAISGSGAGLPAEFEDRFAEQVGAEFCLSVNHGSAALASAFYAVGVGPGDEVITPTAGYLGSYEGALHLGARPVFCEVDPNTLLADAEDVEDRITDRTKAINVIHWNGRVCDMDAFRELGEKYDLPIIEDAAHAHGSHWGDEMVGAIGDITCFSLQGVTPHGKPVCGGEGGIVTTDNREYYERQIAYCHLHRGGMSDELTMEPYASLDREVLGRKWRAHPIAMALANVSLDSLEYRNRKHVEYRNEMHEALADVPGLKPVETYDKSESGGFYGGLRVIYQPEELDGLPVERFVEAAKAEGVSISGPGFDYLEHRRTLFTDGFDLWGEDRGPLGGEFCGLPEFEPYEEGDFPVTEELNERVLSLSCYIEPVDGYLEQQIAALKKVVENADRLA